VTTPEASRPPGYAGIGAGRRAFDGVLAALGLLLLSPLMVAIAVAILIEDGRPVCYSQVRLGEGGRHFRLHKFRKFRRAGVLNARAVTLDQDERLTSVGRLLARTKLDELPQLWNILSGEMSIVGPRPESLAFADCFDGQFRKVLHFRPGIFGPNQIFFRNEGRLFQEGGDPEAFYRQVLFPLKARADLAYFPHRTPEGDLAWIIRGVSAVLGLRLFPGRHPDPINEAENWIRRNAAA